MFLSVEKRLPGYWAWAFRLKGLVGKSAKGEAGEVGRASFIYSPYNHEAGPREPRL